MKKSNQKLKWFQKGTKKYIIQNKQFERNAQTRRN